jgi:hypothetical protein
MRETCAASNGRPVFSATKPRSASSQADRLLGPAVTDVDGNGDDRSDTVSVFNGPWPTIQTLKSQDEEIKRVGNWIAGHARCNVDAANPDLKAELLRM